MNAPAQAESAEVTPGEFENLVVGLGKTGMSCIRYLVACGQSVAAMDSRSNPPGLEELKRDFPHLHVVLGSLPEGYARMAQRLVVSPGVSPDEAVLRSARAAGVEIIGDIELFLRAAASPAVAVTGSNGKSTVSTLVHEMILRSGKRSRLGGNIGVPALDLLAGQAPDFFVLELSSFQLETTSTLAVAAAAILNISPDHMDRYASVAEYATAKQRIFSGEGVKVFNLDDPLLAGIPHDGDQWVGFTLGRPGAGEYGIGQTGQQDWLSRGEEPLMPVDDVALSGAHNLANALAALALGHAIGLASRDMCSVLRTFEGLPHRCQWVGNFSGIDWYNDSKGTNVGAASAAIRGLGKGSRLILIAGGEGKAADFTPLAEAARGTVRHAVLIGKDASRMAQALEDVAPTTYATSMAAAVRTAAGLAMPGDIVLLSPACASFDMFENYQARGDEFMNAVRSLFAGRGSG